jgi:hypothetical protein
MPHRNARLTVHGRQLLVDRVSPGRPVAHVAKEVGVSRQCAHRWVARYAAEGEAGLQDRSSRPQRSPRRTSPAVEAAVVGARRKHRRGPDWLAAEVGPAGHGVADAAPPPAALPGWLRPVDRAADPVL